MKLSSKTDTGVVRKNNEDSLLVIAPWSGLAIEKKACLFVVADGMGGQNAGEVASGIAVTTAREWFKNNSFEDLNTKHMEDLITVVNEKVWTYSQSHPETKGMGTTFSAILFKGEKAIIGHIGDSRIYRSRKGELSQLTNDHSIVGEQVKLGKLTPEQARVSPVRNILSKVLGARQFIQPDIFETSIEIDDQFVLCSDGIYTMIECEEMERIINNTPAEKLSRVLIDRANAGGGKDNSTAIAFKVTEFPIKIPSPYSPQRLFRLIFNFCDNI